MEKYYTPDLGDFCLGFAFEKFILFRDDWVSDKIESSYDYNEVWDVFNEGKQGRYLRIKYLDKEDIESLGWDVDWLLVESAQHRKFSNNRIYLLNSTILNQNILITEIVGEGIKRIFDGECKSKNELRKLMQWLNIKDLN